MAVEDNASFGAWLKQRRMSLDLTQKELAETIGCSISTIRKIELDLRRPSKQITDLLAGCLEIPADEYAAFEDFARGNAPAPSTPKHPSDTPTSVSNTTHSDSLSQASLPRPLTRLIGRERVIDEIRSILWRADVRLLTLTGPPGIGKTRLSIEVAASLQADFTDGVAFVPLAPVSNPDLVISTIAQALGVRELSGGSQFDSLVHVLQDRHMLLVLDNFEQVVDAAIDVARLLSSCRDLKILVTSRAILRVQGEYEYKVPPLLLPDPAHPPKEEELGNFSAIALFVQRANFARPDFQLTPANSQAIADICMRLDGLPLAIELAAARVKVLSPQALLARLSDRMSILTAGARDLPERHKTLRNAIESSYDLLDNAERRLFEQLSVFAGGCTLEAVAAVCYARDSATQEVLEGVTNLIDKSLLVRYERFDGESRFTLLETIREYAAERLAATGSNDVRERHARYFLKLALEAQPNMEAPDQKWWLEKLALEHDNLRSALTWSISAGTPDALEVGLELGGLLKTFWARQGFVTEGRTRLDSLLARRDSRFPAYVAGVTDNLEEIVETLVTQPGVDPLISALTATASLAHRVGDMDASYRYLILALALARHNGNNEAEGDILYNLGTLCNVRNDFNGAVGYFEKALAIKRSTPNRDERTFASTLTDYSWALAHLQNYNSALAYEEESLEIKRRLGDSEGVGRSIFNLSELALTMGDYAATRKYSERVLEIARALGNREGEAHALHHLGLVERAEGRPAEAHRTFKLSLAIFHEFEQYYGALDCIRGLAIVAIDLDRLKRANILSGAYSALSAAMHLADDSPDVSSPITSTSTPNREDKALMQRAWNEGQAMDMPQAIAYALDNS